MQHINNKKFSNNINIYVKTGLIFKIILFENSTTGVLEALIQYFLFRKCIGKIQNLIINRVINDTFYIISVKFMDLSTLIIAFFFCLLLSHTLWCRNGFLSIFLFIDEG